MHVFAYVWCDLGPLDQAAVEAVAGDAGGFTQF